MPAHENTVAGSLASSSSCTAWTAARGLSPACRCRCQPTVNDLATFSRIGGMLASRNLVPASRNDAGSPSASSPASSMPPAAIGRHAVLHALNTTSP